LVHFLVLGILVFAVQRIHARPSRTQIVVGDDTIDSLRARYREWSGRLPSSEDLASVASPTEVELETYFQQPRDRYVRAPRISIRHVFINRSRPSPTDRAIELKKKIDAGLDPETLGDPFPRRGSVW
jgi:hypothetical protein